MTKAKMIETLEAMRNNLRACESIWKDGEYADHDMWIKTRKEWMTIDMVLRMMKEDSFANIIREVYFPKEA